MSGCFFSETRCTYIQTDRQTDTTKIICHVTLRVVKHVLIQENVIHYKRARKYEACYMYCTNGKLQLYMENSWKKLA